MSNIAIVLKGQKIFFLIFMVRLGENVLECYLLLIGLFFFLMEKINKILIAVYFSPNNYFELKLRVLDQGKTGSKLFWMVTCCMFKNKAYWGLGTCCMFFHEISVFFFGHTILDTFKISSFRWISHRRNELFSCLKKKRNFWVEYYSIFWAHYLSTQTGIPAPKVSWI